MEGQNMAKAQSKRGNGKNSKPRSTPRCVSDGHRLSRTDAARKRLGITPETMWGVPDVTKNIIRACGSVDLAIAALAGDESEDAQEFIRFRKQCSPSDLQRTTLEEQFTAAGLSARRFIEVLTGALMQQCGDVTKMMVAVAQPKVVQATIKAATDEVPIVADVDGHRIVVGHTNGDVKAMEIFHKATGFLPTPKGSNTTINLQQLNQTAQLTKGEENEDGDDLPSMDEYLMELQDVVRPKQLNAPPSSEMPVNAPDIEYIDVEV